MISSDPATAVRNLSFLRLPEIRQDRSARFGWVRVRGTIDGVEIMNYNLQSMGNGCLFLPLKAQLRKKLKKEAGDMVHLELYRENAPTQIPEELLHYLMDEPTAHEKFLCCTENEKKVLIEWIYSAKTDDTKTDRIVKTIQKMLNKS